MTGESHSPDRRFTEHDDGRFTVVEPNRNSASVAQVEELWSEVPGAPVRIGSEAQYTGNEWYSPWRPLPKLFYDSLVLP